MRLSYVAYASMKVWNGSSWKFLILLEVPISSSSHEIKFFHSSSSFAEMSITEHFNRNKVWSTRFQSFSIGSTAGSQTFYTRFFYTYERGVRTTGSIPTSFFPRFVEDNWRSSAENHKKPFFALNVQKWEVFCLFIVSAASSYWLNENILIFVCKVNDCPLRYLIYFLFLLAIDLFVV